MFVEYLVCTRLHLIASTAYTHLGGTYLSILSTWEVEAEESGIQSHPQLHSECKTNLGYKRSSEKPNCFC